MGRFALHGAVCCALTLGLAGCTESFTVRELTAENISFTQQEYTSDVPLEVVVDFGDVDPSKLSVKYFWSVDDGTDTSSITGPVVNKSWTRKGQLWTVTVVASHNDKAGKEVTAQVEVVNGAPVIERLRIDPRPATRADTLVVEAEVTDPDGDPYEFFYTWYVDDELQDSLAGPSFDASAVTRGQKVRVEVEAFDGDDMSATSQVTTRVVNALPTAPTVEVRPNGLGGNLVCHVEVPSIDADGDDVNYVMSWERDGVGFVGSTTTWLGDTLPSGFIGWGETWVCRAYPSDGVAREFGDPGVYMYQMPLEPPAMVTVDAGTYTLGQPSTDVGYELGNAENEDEVEVTLSRGFEIMDAEVTMGSFNGFLGGDPLTISCPDCAASGVTWHQAAAYANALSADYNLEACYTCTEGQTGWSCDAPSDPYACEGFRLPTDAEWEIAARSGGDEGSLPDGGSLLVNGQYSCNTSESSEGTDLEDFALYCAGDVDAPQEVRSLASNTWGLFDMAGNVAEWVHDTHRPGLAGRQETDPVYDDGGEGRIVRGGSFQSFPYELRTCYGIARTASYQYPTIGFRLVRTLPED